MSCDRTWWGSNRSAVNGTASTPPEGAVAYQTEDVCGNKVTHRAKTARFSATDNPQVWWLWCAWWNTEDRGWHTEGCTIIDLSMKEGTIGDLASTGSRGRSGTRREAVVLCECLMDQPTNTTAAFKGSFGIVKEDNEKDQFQRLQDTKGDVGTLLGYVFNRIGKSFNVVNTRLEVIPSAMYLCFVPLVAYLLALAHLQLRASCRSYPGHTAYQHRQDSRSNSKSQSNPMHRDQPNLKRTRRLVHRNSGLEEYSGAYWEKHSDGMKTHCVIKYGFGLRTIANHSTDRICKAYWQFMIRNVRENSFMIRNQSLPLDALPATRPARRIPNPALLRHRYEALCSSVPQFARARSLSLSLLTSSPPLPARRSTRSSGCALLARSPPPARHDRALPGTARPGSGPPVLLVSLDCKVRGVHRGRNGAVPSACVLQVIGCDDGVAGRRGGGSRRRRMVAG